MTFPIPLPADDAPPYTYTDPIRRSISASNDHEGRIDALESGGSSRITGLTETAGIEIEARVVRIGPDDYDAAIPTLGPDSASLVLDKTNTVNDASVLFRDAGSQKWEIGLPGDNDLHFKRITGPEAGPTYTDVLIGDHATGKVWAPLGFGVGTIPAEPLHVIKQDTVGSATAKVENTAATGSQSAGVTLSGRSHSWTLHTDVGRNGGDNFGISDENYPPRLMVTPTAVGINTDSPGEAFDVNGRVKLRNTTPPATPSGGGVLFVQDGALKYIGSSGTVTTIAPA